MPELIPESLNRLEELLRQIAEAQLRTQNLMGDLAQAQTRTQTAIGEMVVTLTEGQMRNQTAINEMSTAVTRYVDSANSRMEIMERNLDNLIRIITAEHSNGKGGKK